MPWSQNTWMVFILIWLMQFVAITFTPAALGIMLDQVEAERRTTASSLANLSFNVLGYLPAPLIYTQIKNAYTDEVKGNQVAMAVILYSNAASFLFLCLALCLRKKKLEVEDVNGVDIMNPSSGLRDTMSENTGGDLPMSLKNLSKD